MLRYHSLTGSSFSLNRAGKEPCDPPSSFAIQRFPARHSAPCAHLAPRPEIAEPPVSLAMAQDISFVNNMTARLMRACIRHHWDPEEDPSMENLLPPTIVTVLRLSEKERHAMGMSDALLAIGDLQERRKVLMQMVLTLCDLHSHSPSFPTPFP